jgi:5'-nucleotidase
LVTNDDGFESEGLRVLVDSLKDLARVIVVAPSSEKSACSHSLTLSHPLRFIKLDDDFYKLDDGTPSDCIYLSLNVYFKDAMPDLVISGINKGSNMGEDITYSGTVGGAMEGVLQGVPSIAISQVCKNSCKDMSYHGYELAGEFIKDFVKKIFEGGFPLGERKLININIPPLKPDECKGLKVTKAGYRLYGNDAHKHINPRGIEYYWLGTHHLAWEKRGDGICDLEAVEEGYISVTPVMLDLTSYEDLERLERFVV